MELLDCSGIILLMDLMVRCIRYTDGIVDHQTLVPVILNRYDVVDQSAGDHQAMLIQGKEVKVIALDPADIPHLLPGFGNIERIVLPVSFCLIISLLPCLLHLGNAWAFGTGRQSTPTVRTLFVNHVFLHVKGPPDCSDSPVTGGGP